MLLDFRGAKRGTNAVARIHRERRMVLGEMGWRAVLFAKKRFPARRRNARHAAPLFPNTLTYLKIETFLYLGLNFR